MVTETPKVLSVSYYNPNTGKTTTLLPSYNPPKTFRTKFDGITPKVDFESIKKDEIYHIPPFNGYIRRDIKIIYACSTYITYQVIKGGGLVKTISKGDILTKFLVKKRNT